jgi:hypothetical protein
MRIAFATTQSLTGSTTLGRIVPLARAFAQKGDDCSILIQAPAGAAGSPAIEPTANVTFRVVGTEPFRRTSSGKERLGGIQLIFNMLATALRTAWALQKLQPDVIIISKPLPANVLGASLYSFLTTRSRMVLDVDDFELTANKLSSIAQRAVIHWSERRAAALVDVIITASPFLSDHFRQLTQNTKPVKIIPTGLSIEHGVGVQEADRTRSTTLAYLGSVSVSSGHRVDLLPEILLKARAVHPFELLIAGDGDDIATLKTELDQNKLASSVTWFGRFKPADLTKLITEQTIILDPVDDSIANRA